MVLKPLVERNETFTVGRPDLKVVETNFDTQIPYRVNGPYLCPTVPE